MVKIKALHTGYKLHVTLLLFILFSSCSSNSKRLTENSKLFHTYGNLFSLKFTQGTTTEVIDGIERIGWNNNSVLVQHQINGKLRWTYIFDGGKVLKSWGPYSVTEFAKRSKELNILNYNTLPVKEAWNK
ncbi:MAG: hypothetical protein ACO1OQ_16320 [Rufibacter sp.]